MFGEFVCGSLLLLCLWFTEVLAYIILQVVDEKELVIAEIENKKVQELEAAEKTAERLAQRKSENHTSPWNDKWQSILEIPEIASMSQKKFTY